MLDAFRILEEDKGIKKEDILAIFQKEAKDIRVGDMHNGEFDFWVRFPEENEQRKFIAFCSEVYYTNVVIERWYEIPEITAFNRVCNSYKKC